MRKNKVASYLKVGSIVLFVLSVFGALIGAQKETIPMADGNYVYQTATIFDARMFFIMIIASMIGCSLIYAFGELVELTAKNNALLEQQNHLQAADSDQTAS